MKTLPILTCAIAAIAAGTSLWSAPSNDRSPAERSAAGQRTPLANPIQLAQVEAERKDQTPAAAASSTVGEPSATGENSNSAALEILRQAHEKLIRQSISAEIKEVVAIGDRRFKARGSYLQGKNLQGKNLKLRLEFQVQVGNSLGSLLEVCDGQVLWTSSTIQRISPGKTVPSRIEKTPQNTRVTRRDIGQLLEAASSKEKTPRIMLMAELGLGGLPALLASLERAMVFDSLEKQTLDGDKSFHVIQGQWNQSHLERWQRMQGAQGDALPAYVPDAVRVYFEEESLFPQRIVYLKRHPERQRYRPMVTLDFLQVKFNVDVTDADFDYEPPDRVTVEDVTNDYLKTMMSADMGLPQTPQTRPSQ